MKKIFYKKNFNHFRSFSFHNRFSRQLISVSASLFLVFSVLSCATNGKLKAETCSYSEKSTPVSSDASVNSITAQAASSGYSTVFKSDENFSFLWKPVEQNFSVIDCTSGKKSENFSKITGFSSDYKKTLKFYALKINLSSPELKITMHCSDPSEWEKTFSVKQFCRKNGAFAAFNTTPFLIKQYINPFSKAKPAGLIINNGKTVSPEAENYAALLLFKNQTGFSARILQSQKNASELKPDFAMGGFFQVLKDGNTIPFETDRNTRCSAGTTEDGKTLFILCGYKMTFNECGEILKILGAKDVMQFDGGNSTDLVVNGKSVIREFITRTVPAILGFGS